MTGENKYSGGGMMSVPFRGKTLSVDLGQLMIAFSPPTENKKPTASFRGALYVLDKEGNKIGKADIHMNLVIPDKILPVEITLDGLTKVAEEFAEIELCGNYPYNETIYNVGYEKEEEEDG